MVDISEIELELVPATIALDSTTTPEEMYKRRLIGFIQNLMSTIMDHADKQGKKSCSNEFMVKGFPTEKDCTDFLTDVTHILTNLGYSVTVTNRVSEQAGLLKTLTVDWSNPNEAID